MPAPGARYAPARVACPARARQIRSPIGYFLPLARRALRDVKLRGRRAVRLVASQLAPHDPQPRPGAARSRCARRAPPARAAAAASRGSPPGRRSGTRSPRPRAPPRARASAPPRGPRSAAAARPRARRCAPRAGRDRGRRAPPARSRSRRRRARSPRHSSSAARLRSVSAGSGGIARSELRHALREDLAVRVGDDRHRMAHLRDVARALLRRSPRPGARA